MSNPKYSPPLRIVAIHSEPLPKKGINTLKLSFGRDAFISLSHKDKGFCVG